MNAGDVVLGRMRRIALDVLGLAGLAAAVNGVRLVYPPAAWIVAGGAIVAWVVLKRRTDQR